MSGRDLLAGAELLLVDGNNLLHRESGGAGEGPLRGLLARLQSAVSAPVHTIVVLDGHPAPGAPSRLRISARLELRHAGSRSADNLIVQLAASQPPDARARTVVVTDDRVLTERARSAGSRTQRLGWLQQVLARPARRSQLGAGPPAQSGKEDDEAREGWRPGRGATHKRGNPRRNPRGRRDVR